MLAQYSHLVSSSIPEASVKVPAAMMARYTSPDSVVSRIGRSDVYNLCQEIANEHGVMVSAIAVAREIPLLVGHSVIDDDVLMIVVPD